MLGNAGEAGVFLDDAFDRTSGETAEVARGIDGVEIFAVIKEKWSERIGASIEIFLDAVGGGFGNKDRTILAAFTTNHEFTAFEIDRITIKLDKFGDAQAAGIKEFNNGAVAEAGFVAGVDFAEDTLDFVVAEESNLFANDMRKLDEGRVERFNVAFGKIFKKAA